ncbi:MAG: tRNA (adenosine(37)-N6)-dimethylallyltransferase MiaA [bacterium]|nr:tRNA (adenosine(37)-N6)-dimethylallyltransferase MiaA [bacterium]
MQKLSLIVIVGPTASGKSALAVRLARKFNGEIISADSRQVYRGLDIGTGKVSRREMRGVPHHLLDVADPRQPFSVVEFQQLAQRAIRDITGRGKIPILVGGTGFWIDAVAYGIELPRVPPNPRLRKQLSKKDPLQLLTLLQRLDPERARTVEHQNPRRLIRAIEIAKALGRTPKVERRMPYRVLWLGLRPAAAALRRQIKKRAEQMVRTGITGETKSLLRRGVTRERIREFGFEYRAILDFLEKRISRRELADAIAAGSRAYARRQMTWWKRNNSIRWVQKPADAERQVRRFIPLEAERQSRSPFRRGGVGL